MVLGVHLINKKRLIFQPKNEIVHFFIIKNSDSRPEALEFSKVNENEDKDRFEGTIVDGNLKFGTLVATL